MNTITTNVKGMQPGDVYRPNGSGPSVTVDHVGAHPVRDKWVRIHHTDGSHRDEHHTKRRTVRRAA